HRRARQAEEDAVRHPEPWLVTTQHRREPATESAIEHLHLRFGPERLEDLLALLPGHPGEVQLIVVTEEVHPLPSPGDRRQLRQPELDRIGGFLRESE